MPDNGELLDEKSMVAFTPETPLGQAVQELLLAHSEGLVIPKIRRLLRREKGLFVSESNLGELLGYARVCVKSA